jgi:hypothetical protein
MDVSLYRDGNKKFFHLKKLMLELDWLSIYRRSDDTSIKSVKAVVLVLAQVWLTQSASSISMGYCELSQKHRMDPIIKGFKAQYAVDPSKLNTRFYNSTRKIHFL